MQQLVPLTPAPNQTITVALSVDNAPLTLTLVLHYNEVAIYWAMTIYDVNNNLLLDSIPLITGNDPACNILKQYSYLQIGSCFIINETGLTGVGAPNYPNNSDLGTSFAMIWGDTP